MRLPKPNKIIAEKYVTGLSKFRNKAAKVKLSANESALGPSPKAIKEYSRLSKNFKRYPDSEGISLRKTIAKKFKLDLNRIILGSGSDQILELICKAFLRKGDEVIVPKYSFLIYRLYSQINGAKILYSKENNFTISVDDILKKVDLSHTTHPDLPLIKALQMTMCFPIMFQPICYGDDCYVDGGLLNNFPLNDFQHI